MAFVLAERVAEYCSTTGTGTLTLTGAQIGCQSFASAIGVSNTCYYAINNIGTVSEWEVGIGTVGAGNTLTRTSVLSSSAGNALVSFSAGVKSVFVTYPGSEAAFFDGGNSFLLQNQTSLLTNNTNLPLAVPSLDLDFVEADTLDARVTVSRPDGVNITGSGSYYDGQTFTLAEQNLLTYSQDFNNPIWTMSAINIVPNAGIAPDGTTTATLFTVPTSTTTHNFIQNVSINGTVVASIFVKPNGYTSFSISNGAQTIGADFSGIGSTNTVSNIGVGVGTITSFGNGWYRLSVIMPSVTNVYWFMYFRSSYAGDDVSGMYLWGAQIEKRSANTPYAATSNHNLISYSQDFTNSYWNKNGIVTYLTPSFADPLGTNTALKLIESTSNTFHEIYFANNMVAGNTYTFSVYLKAAERTYASIYLFDNENFNQAWINLSNGTQIPTDNSANVIITTTGIGSTWYRCSISSSVTISAITNSSNLPYLPYGGVAILNSGTYTNPVELTSNTYTSAADNITTRISANAFSTVGVTLDARVFLDLTTVAGRRYIVKCSTIPLAGYNLSLFIRNGTGGNGTILTSSYVSPSIALSFIASSTTTTLLFTNGNPINYSVFGISVQEIPGQYLGDGNSGIYAWGAQLERAATTTTTSSANGLNLITYSNTFDDASWLKSNTSIQYNLLTYSSSMNAGLWTTYCGNNSNVTYNTTDVTSPIDGTYSAVKIIRDGGTVCAAGSCWGFMWGGTGTFISGQVYTISIWGKSVTGGISALLGMNDSFQFGITLTTSWQRFSYTSAIVTNLDRGLQIVVAAGGGTCYFWGAQLVTGNTAGDYTATTSTSLPVKYQAPDSSFSAEKFMEDATNNQHTFYKNSVGLITLTAGITYTFSTYAKAVERTAFRLIMDSVPAFGSPTPLIAFDLSTQTISTSGNVTSAFIRSAGNGWYYCSYSAKVVTTTTTLYPTIQMLNSSSVWAGDGKSGMLFWNMQFGQATLPSKYALNASSVSSIITNYIPKLLTAPANTPRFDSDPITGKPLGLLIEPLRVNYCFPSSTQGCSTTGTATSISNAAIAPDGTLTASLFTPNSSGAAVYLPGQGNGFTAGDIVNISIYLKNKDLDFITFYVGGFSLGGSVRRGITINLNTMTTAATYLNLPDNIIYTSVGNGWYRVSFSYPSYNFDSPMLRYFTDIGFTPTGGVYFWGIQQERSVFGNYATRANTIGSGSTSTTVVLDSGASTTDNIYSGSRLVVANTFIEQATISSYVGSTRTATISGTLTYPPAAGIGYTIIPATVPSSFPTSYISTTSVALTCSADLIYINSTNLATFFNKYEGTIYVECDNVSIGAGYIFSLVDNNIWSNFSLTHGITANNASLAGMIVNSSGFTGLLYNYFPISTTFRSAIAYDGKTLKISTNGSFPTVSGSLGNAGDNTFLVLGRYLWANWYYSGHIKKFTYYPKALSNTELQGMTSG